MAFFFFFSSMGKKDVHKVFGTLLCYVFNMTLGGYIASSMYIQFVLYR